MSTPEKKCPECGAPMDAWVEVGKWRCPLCGSEVPMTREEELDAALDRLLGE